MAHRRLDYQAANMRQRIYVEDGDVQSALNSAQFSWRFEFGRFKGQRIVAVPTAYLIWMRHKTPNLDIARRCTDEIERRKRLHK